MTVSNTFSPQISTSELKGIVDTVGDSINTINQHIKHQRFSDFGKAGEGAVFWGNNPTVLAKDLDQNRAQLVSIEQAVNSKLDRLNAQSSQETDPAKKEEFQKEIASLTDIQQKIHQVKRVWQKCHFTLSAAVAPDYSRPDIMEIAKQTRTSTQGLVKKFKNIPEPHPAKDLLELHRQYTELSSVEECLMSEIERLGHQLQATREKAKGTNNNSEEIKAEGIEKKIAHLIDSKKEVEQAKREWLHCYQQYQRARVTKAQQALGQTKQALTQKKQYQIEDLVYRLQRELQTLEQDKQLSSEDKEAVQTCLKDLSRLLSESEDHTNLFDEECRALLGDVMQGEGALVEKTFLKLRRSTQQTIISELNGDPSPSNDNSFVGIYGLEKIKSALLSLLRMPTINREITTNREKQIELSHCLQHLPDEILLNIFSYLPKEDTYSLFRALAGKDGYFHSFPNKFKEIGLIADCSNQELILKKGHPKLQKSLSLSDEFLMGPLNSLKDWDQSFPVFEFVMDGTMKIWDLKTNTYTPALQGHDSPVQSFLKEGELLFFHSSDETLKVWDLKTDTCVATLKEDTDGVTCLEKEGDLLLWSSRDGTIKIWDLKTKTYITTLKGYSNSPGCLLKEGDLLLSGSQDGKIRIWDLKTNTCSAILKAPGVNCLAKEGDFLASSSWNGKIKIWDLKTNTHIATLKAPGVRRLAKKENFLFSGLNDGTIKIWDLKTNTCITTVHAHTDQVKGLKIQGNLLISNSWNEIKVWDLNHDAVFDLIEMASSVLTIGSCAGFSNLPADVKNGVYKELCAIEHFSNDSLGCAERAFLKQNNQTTSDQNRARAIYRFLLREIVSRMGNKRGLSSAKKLFKMLPGEVKNAVYGELFKIITFQDSYWGCAEHAFLTLHGQNTSNEKRCEAILNYLKNTSKK